MARKVKLQKKRKNPTEHDEAKGMTPALDASTARTGPPSEDDAPRVSTFPMTAAAREARRLDRQSGRNDARR